MSLKKKFERLFYIDDEEFDENVEHPKKVKQTNEQVHASDQQKAQLVSIQSAKKTAEVFLCEPRVYSEVQDISDQLMKKRAVIVNLQKIDRDKGARIIDFLSGTVYTLNGTIQRIGADIFLCTPENIAIDGEITSSNEWNHEVDQ